MDDREARAYLACAEPTWHTAVNESQLAGILNLTCLLSPSIYLSDVHVGDNINFLRSYIRGRPDGLYARLKEFGEARIIRLLLRDKSLRPQLRENGEILCSSFRDVYDAWLRQDPRSSWIHDDFSPERMAFFEDLDSWASRGCTERYSYEEVKVRFMASVRSAKESYPWLIPVIEGMPERIAPAYLDVVGRDWFSLSDLYSLFQGAGIASSDRLMLYHGLLNELTYCEYIGATIVGVDRDRTPIESEVWTERRRLRTVSSGELLERALAVLDAPSLAVLGLLSAKEVLHLREVGRPYFDLLQLAEDRSFGAAGQPDFGGRFVYATIEYWREICDHLVSLHPSAARRPTKLAVFLGGLPGVLGDIVQNAFSFGLELGGSAMKLAHPAVGTLGDAARPMVERINMRFLLLAESTELKRLRSVIPDRSWFRRSQPDVRSVSP